MKKIKLLILAAIAALQINATDVTSVYNTDIVSGSSTLKIDKFNKSTGTLTNIVVAINANINGTITLINPNQFDIIGQAGASTTVTLSSGRKKSPESLGISYGYDLQNLTIPAGAEVSRNYNISVSFISTPTDINGWIGNNSVNLYLSVKPFPYAYGLPLGALMSQPNGPATITVTYQYE